MTDGPRDLSRLSLNQRTTARWSLREAIDGCLAGGLPAIGVWREQVAEAGLATAASWLRDSGLRVSSVCRGGFFTVADPAARREAHDDNLRALDEAATLGAPVLVLVPGGLPAGDRDLAARPRPRRRRRRGAGRRGRCPRRAARHRADAPDLRRRPGRRVHPRPGPRHRRAAPGRAGRRRRRHVPPVVGAGRARPGRPRRRPHRVVPDRRLDHAAAAGRAPLARAWSATGTSTSPPSPPRWPLPATRGDVEVEIFNADLWARPGAEVVETLSRRYVELVEPFLAPLSVGS